MVTSKILAILEYKLKGEIRTNSKGYKMLPDCLRIIWGDGIKHHTIEPLLAHIKSLGWSTANFALGSGGGLLQMWNRDTQEWAFKCCALKLRDGTWIDVRKDPVTSSSKRSKAGRLDLIRMPDGSLETIVLRDDQISHPDSVMVTWYEDGEILYFNDLEEVRARQAEGRIQEALAA